MPKESLSEKQLTAISLLVAGHGTTSAAKKIGVTPQTICNWRKLAEFEATLNKNKWNVVHEAVDSIRSAAVAAALNLKDLSQNADSDEVRRKACMNILELTGIYQPNAGHLGMGIGPDTISGIERERNPPKFELANLEEMLKLHNSPLVKS